MIIMMHKSNLNKRFCRKICSTGVTYSKTMKRIQSCIYNARVLTFLLVHSFHYDIINSPVLPDFAPQPCHLKALPVAVAGGDVVKHRVQAGVEDDQSHGDPPGIVDDVGGDAALDDTHASEKVQQVDHMAGQEAEDHDGQDGVDHSQRFLGCFGLYFGNAPCSQRVTHQDDQGRQQGAKDQTQEAVRRQSGAPLSFGEIFKAAVASRFIPLGLQGTHEDEDQNGHSDGAPECRAHDHRGPGAAKPQVDVRVDGGHVAIHTDASHEADAHVDVGKEQDAGEAAGEVAKNPVVPVDMVVDPERQGAEDDDVGQSQVADVHAEGRTRRGPAGEDDERSHIAWEAKN